MNITTDLQFAEVEVAPTLAVQVAGSSSMNPADIGQAIRNAFHTGMEYVARRGLMMNNQPRVIYTSYDPKTVSFLAVLPVADSPSTPESEPISVGMISGGKAYRFTHHGPYPNLAQTYNQITAFMIEKGLMASEADWAKYMPMWEEYLNDPEKTPPEKLLTYIYLPKV